MTETAIVESAAPPAPSLAPEREQRIRIRAYELYQARNCEPGHEEEDWLRAEADLVETPAEVK